MRDGLDPEARRRELEQSPEAAAVRALLRGRFPPPPPPGKAWPAPSKPPARPNLQLVVDNENGRD